MPCIHIWLEFRYEWMDIGSEQFLPILRHRIVRKAIIATFSRDSDYEKKVATVVFVVRNISIIL